MPHKDSTVLERNATATDSAESVSPAESTKKRWFKRTKPIPAQPPGELDDEIEGQEHDRQDAADSGQRLGDRVAGSRLNFLRNSSACLLSMVLHLSALIALGVWMVPELVKAEVETLVSSFVEERPEDELVEIKLEQELEAAEAVTAAVFSSAPPVGASGAVSGNPASNMELDPRVVEEFDSSVAVSVEPPMLVMPSSKKLIDAIPEGEFKGDPRAIVDNYDQAMDRITQEVMWQLDKTPVLLVWLFDQSGSMKNDQEEISQRINRVYTELGLVNRDNGDRLLTSITCFGENVYWLLKPTSNRDQIFNTVANIPQDSSGLENMCEAIGRTLAWHREYRKGGRRMMLILVTDESGERDNNYQYLEPMIAEAKSQDCRIYCLGREAVFGYPYAHLQWRHPQTGHIHWLQIDRGPETAFVEQLQTDGFRRRFDAFASGFGPYEQARMCRETGGVFFMLPSLESNLVRAQGNLEERRYELEAMRAYRPDLAARIELFAARDKYPLRALLWKVVSDLDPHNAQASRNLEVLLRFSRDVPTFVKQARENQQKARMLIDYFGWAQKMLEDGRRLRQQEPEPRWQGNYDLIYAQTVAYQARLYEYGVTLQEFLNNPQAVPLTKPPNLRLSRWDVTTCERTLSSESEPYIDKSRELFLQVMDDHPGTPWAARAKWELNRGFGVELRPSYSRPSTRPTTSKPSTPRIPIPKL